jgi:alpha-D-ribose 1-methylphosphonate 5-triphosphate synthase subunit PhnL
MVLHGKRGNAMETLRKAYENLPEDSSAEQIEITAKALERRKFSPVLLLEVRDFTHLTKRKMLDEFDRVMALPPTAKALKAVVAINDPQQVKEKHLATLLNQYLLLCGLRKDDASAWDVVNELYEDD